MTTTAANGKVWAGNATHGIQGFHEIEQADAGQINLDDCAHYDDEPDDFEWVRIESMMGQRFHLDPERTVSPPKMRPEDNVAQMTRKMMLYVKKTQDLDGLSDAEIAEMVGLEPSDVEMEDRLRSAFGLDPSMRVVTGLDKKGQPVYLSIDNTFAKTGQFRGGFSAANISQRLVAHQFQEQFAEQHLEFGSAEIATLFRRIEDKSFTGKRYAYLWDEERYSPLMQVAVQVAGGPEVADRIDSMTADEIRKLLATLPSGEVATYTTAGKDIEPGYELTYRSNFGTVRRVLKASEVEAELAGTTERAKRAQLNRAYRAFLDEQLDVEYDFGLQRGYIRRAAEGHSATVFEQKKNVPQSHLDAAEKGFFKTSGDFRHVEVDSDTDLDKLAQVEKDYARLRKYLPQTEKTPALRFRKTGRHKAQGVYHPHADNIAVDPRHPSSMVHEFIHHIDHTAGERNISSSMEFTPILRQIQRALAASDDPYVKSKMDYLRTPTEVLSRSAEAYFAWTHPNTSLNGTADRYANEPAYAVMEPMRKQIIAFWDKTLAELGAEVPGY